MRALEPGCALIARGEDVRVRRYFRLEAREHEDDAAATVENVRFMLERAVDDIAPPAARRHALRLHRLHAFDRAFA